MHGNNALSPATDTTYHINECHLNYIMISTYLKSALTSVACLFPLWNAAATEPSGYAALQAPMQTALKPIGVGTEEQPAVVLNYKEVPRSRMLRSFDRQASVTASKVYSTSGATPGSSPVYAVMMYSSAWTEESGTHKGIYSIPTDGSSTVPVPVKLDNIFTECGYAVGKPDKYHFAQVTKTYGVVMSLRQYTYNTTDWSAGSVLSGDLTSRNFMASDAAYDPLSTNVYASVVDNRDGLWGIYRIATETKLEFKKIAELEQPFVAMSFDTTGNLYAVTSDGRFLNYDIARASATTISSNLPLSTKYTSGTLDPTGKIFYYAVCNDTESALYSIETTSGKASKMYDFANGEEFVGMYIPSATAIKAVPDAPADLTLTFDGGSLTGKVSFTCPKNNIDASVAEGELTYTVYASNLKIAEGRSAYGEKVELEVTLPRNGEYAVSVRLSNAAGEGPTARVNSWIGNDIPPKISSEPKVTYANGKATIKWYAPSAKTGVNGGYVDKTKYTYTVIRNNDGKVVADGISATTAQDELEAPEELTMYTYNVTVNYEGAKSAPTTSATLPLGNIYPPFQVDFTVNPMALFTTLDVNKDYKTWTYSSVYKRIHVATNTSKDMDDWLFTLPLKLKAGHAYKLTFNTFGGANNTTQTMEVLLGTAPSPEAMTTATIMPRQDYNNVEKTPLTVTYNIEVPADGIYHIGFHALSAKNNSHICLNNISITAPTAFDSPSPVTEFKAAPDMSGALKATLSLTAPTTTYKGEVLKSLSSMVIYADNEAVATFNNPTPGQTYTYIHDTGKRGNIEYSAVAANEFGESQAVHASAFVGHTVPYAPSRASMKENSPGNVTFTWSEVTKDANGKSLDPSTITYAVMELDQNTYKWVARADKIKGLTHTMQVIKPADGQDFMSLAIGAENEYGRSKYLALEQVPIGVPYELPFIESNAGNLLNHTFLTKKLNGDGLVRWNQGNNSSIEGMVPADNDNGYFYMDGNAVGDKAALVSGKIDLTTAQNPMLSIAYVGFSGDQNRIGINIICNGEETPLKEWETSAPSASWQEMIIPLDAYKGQTIQFVLYGELRTSKQVFADRIQIIDYPRIDLAVSAIVAPESLRPGASGEVKVLVENLGLTPISDYTVNFYNNGQCVCTMTPSGELPFHGQAVYVYNVNASPLSADEMKIYAEVQVAGDDVESNNRSAEKVIVIEKSQLPAPRNLTAEKAADGGVRLTWDDADMSSLADGTVTEDCENYESFTIDGFGEWTTIDADKSVSLAFQSIDVPHLGTEAFGFMLFDCSDSKFNSTYNAHSGNKYFMAFTNNAQKMDDWLISPELNGKAQTISFFARGYHPNYPESFEILYSTTGKESTDFKAIAVHKNVGYEFREYSADLPEGARYFAIRCVSKGGMMFIVDDITYAPKSYDIKVEGYNVYRDGSLVASRVPSREYIDDPKTGDLHVYNVTAIYNYGESGVSAPASIEYTSGIDGVTAQTCKVSVDGTRIMITAPAGTQVVIYTVAGLTLYSETSNGFIEYDALPGVYAVRTGDKITKIIVK